MRDPLRKRAQELRRDATKEENHLWYDFLRKYLVQFRRQVILGPYIADFYCAQAGLVVELDGRQHFEDRRPEYDARRTAYLETIGMLVIRFTNQEIKRNFEGVCIEIAQTVKRRLLLPHPSRRLPRHLPPEGEG